MNPALTCEDCAYLQDERAGMWLDNGAPLDVACREATDERCHDHAQGELFTEFESLKKRTAALVG